jgi:VanZ family protein
VKSEKPASRLKYLATILISIIILVLILLPGSSVPDPKLPGLDKLVHIFLFLAWTVAIVHDFKLRWYTALAVAIVFSLFTELIQLGADGRTFDWMDLLADTAGAIAGIVSSAFIIRITKKVLRR